MIIADVWDQYHAVYLAENGIWTLLANLPINFGHDAFYYRLIRSGDEFTLRWSRDDTAYGSAGTWTLSPNLASMPQAFGISGQAFYSDPSIVYGNTTMSR